ncbi:MAG TPA: DUF4038 domain-containing protein [Chthonomonadaceae bacterium]|nr:DUF4038 domain-containing protein [Chthonomonadaceae bacterium]
MRSLRVSTDGHTFIDGEGKPFFWLGDTQWELFRRYSLEEARTILEKRRRQGFTVFQVMLTGVGDGTQANLEGETPWIADDPAAPNEAYFRRADPIVVEIARQVGMVLVIGVFHQLQRDHITTANARDYARWVAQRYQEAPHIVWSMYPAAKPEYLPVLRELAAGLREGDRERRLITVHPDPSPASSSFIHEEPWLDFHSIQTYKHVELIAPMVANDYALTPTKPVVMAEGAYEAGTEYGFEVTPLWVRRQAYYSYLCGASHTYGHNDLWRVLPTWLEALDAEGARQMGVLKQVFLERKEWWSLVPDSTILVEGGATQGPVLNLAARHAAGKWIMVYLGAQASFAVDTKHIAGAERATAFWTDPRNGHSSPIGDVPTGGVLRFTTPEGWEDALLIVEAAGE